MQNKKNTNKLAAIVCTICLIMSSVLCATASVSAASEVTTPILSKAESVLEGVKITWAKSKNADNYRVFVKNGSSWKTIGNTKGTQFTDKNVKSNTTYTYTVRCTSADGKTFTSDYNKNGVSVKYFQAPSFSKIEDSTQGIKLHWNTIPGVSKYRVFRFDEATSKWIGLINTSETLYTDMQVKAGEEYKYTIRCLSNDCKKFISGYNPNAACVKYTYGKALGVPVLKSTTPVANGMKVSWEKVQGADRYCLFFWNGSAWKSLGTTTATEHTDTIVKSGSTVTYTVRCISCDKQGYTSLYNTTGIKATYHRPPSITSISNEKNGQKIKWNAVSGAKYYRLYVKTNGTGWQKILDTDKTEYLYKHVKDNVNYEYVVRCVSGNNGVITSYYDKVKSSKFIRPTELKVLTKISNPDPNYKTGTYTQLTGKTLSSYERTLIENIVRGEFGDNYTGSVYIAQCIRDALVYKKCSSPSALQSEFGYVGYKAKYSSGDDNAVKAVRYVFDEGGCGVQHRMLVMCNGYSAWHETQHFITSLSGYWGTVKFYDFWN